MASYFVIGRATFYSRHTLPPRPNRGAHQVGERGFFRPRIVIVRNFVALLALSKKVENQPDEVGIDVGVTLAKFLDLPHDLFR